MIPYNRRKKNYYTLIKQKMVIFTKKRLAIKQFKQ